MYLTIGDLYGIIKMPIQDMIDINEAVKTRAWKQEIRKNSKIYEG